MKSAITVIPLFLLVISLMLNIPVDGAKPNLSIPNQYMVELDDTMSIQEFENQYDIKVLHKYNHAIKGLAFKASDSVIDEIKNDPRIMKLQQDQKVSITAQTIPTVIS